MGLFKVSHILVEARQFLSFLAPENLGLLIFFKNFLGFGHFEPQFSYKSFLIKKNKCKFEPAYAPGSKLKKVFPPKNWRKKWKEKSKVIIKKNHFKPMWFFSGKSTLTDFRRPNLIRRGPKGDFRDAKRRLK